MKLFKQFKRVAVIQYSTRQVHVLELGKFKGNNLDGLSYEW